MPIPIASLFKENELAISKPNSPRIKTYENTIRFELPTFLLNADSRLLDTEGTYQTFKINVKKLIIERYSTLCTKTGCKACYTTYNLIQLDGILDPRSLGYRRRLPHPRLECCSFCPGLPSDADGMIHTNQAVN